MGRPNRKNYFTVVDVFRDLGFSPIPEDTWEAGILARNLYEKSVGEPPALELRAKTNGGGSHCFAVYPPIWRPRIEDIVKKIASTKANQLTLF